MFFLLWALNFAQVMSGVIEKTLVVIAVPANPDGYPLLAFGVFEMDGDHPLFELNATVCKPQGFLVQNCSQPYTKVDGKCLCRPFPGPEIRATVGDTLKISVLNRLDTTIISIHWHGLKMRNNCWMDGTLGITELGILPGESFTYVFEASADDVGTHWYHSHAGVQYGDGLLGPIIIEDPDDVWRSDPVYNYEQDVSIVLQDWMHEPGNLLLQRYKSFHGAIPTFSPQYPWPVVGILLNGRGQFNCSSIETKGSCEGTPSDHQCLVQRNPFLAPCNASETILPVDIYRCRAGKKLRVRLINGAASLGIRFMVDYHPVTVITKDGNDVQKPPMAYNQIALGVGERYDILISCDQDPTKKYKIWASVATGFVPGGTKMKYYDEVSSYAWLSYVDTDATYNLTPSNLSDISPFERGISDINDIFLEYRVGTFNNKTFAPATRRIVLHVREAWNGKEWKNGDPNEFWLINDASFVHPKEPLLWMRYQNEPWLVNEKTPNALKPNWTYAGITSKDPFETIVYQLEQDEVLEVVLLNDDAQQHPWHIHGHQVCLLGFVENLTKFEGFEYDETFGKLEEEVVCKSFSDTWETPAKGFMVFRFKADNPGAWIMHCHMEWHLALGMAVVFSTEQNGKYAKSLAPPPPEYRFQITVQRQTMNDRRKMWTGFAIGVIVTLLCVLCYHRRAIAGFCVSLFNQCVPRARGRSPLELGDSELDQVS